MERNFRSTNLHSFDIYIYIYSFDIYICMDTYIYVKFTTVP